MIVEVKNLTKKYGSHVAVSDLSFEIEKGKIYGFLGPNGAGKSTTMNMMTGCLAATSGTVTIGGYDIFEEPEKAKKLIGYLPEIPPLYVDRTPKEYLTFVARAKGINKADIEKEVLKVMENTKITDVSERLIKNLSKGYKQRVGIAQAILGDPELIILDEPTVGLDPLQIIEIRQLIKELSEKHTVILSSHILSEVQAVCETIMIISKGKLIACDTAENLEKMFKASVNIVVKAECSKDAATKLLSESNSIISFTVEDENELAVANIEVSEDNAKEICKDIFFTFADNKMAILELKMEKASLEDIFIELTGNENMPENVEVKENEVEENEVEEKKGDNEDESNI